MTSHDLYQTFDSENAPMYVCLACKAVFSAHTPIDLLESSPCIGDAASSVTMFINGEEMPIKWTTAGEIIETWMHNLASDFLSSLTGRGETTSHYGITDDATTRKGTDLLDDWQKGRGTP